MNHSEFTHQLIKGRIAEIIFEQMMRETDKFTVLSFGYEKILPELARMQGRYENDVTLQTIRRAPDFAVISKRRKKVRLVEVKFRSRFDTKDVLKIAEDIHSSWDPCYLFLVTLDSFYYCDVENIIKKNGFIPPLSEDIVSKEMQEEYLKVLKYFY